MTRREQRENIFKLLFKVEFNSIDEMEEQIRFSIDADDRISDEDRDYIINKTNNIIDLMDDIDGIITGVSDGWSLDRIGKAELAILRLGIYEMKYDDDIPFKVAINEAVELSKRYCNEDAKSFINALLAKVE